MRAIIYCLLNVLIILAPTAASADDDTTTCQAGKGTDAERLAACDRVLTASSDAKIISATHLAKADIFGKARRWNDQFVELDAAVKSDPTSWKALDQRAMLKDFYKQDRKGALADLDAAIKLGPTDYEVYQHRGYLRIFAGDYDGALADLNTALPHLSSNSFALLNRGAAKLAKKDYDGAIADFTTNIAQKNPWLHIALAQRCSAYVGKGNNAAALDDCNQAIKLVATTPSAYAYRGRVYLAMGDAEKALADFNTALAKRPNTLSFYEGRGEAYELNKDYDNARADYQSAATKSQASYRADELALQQTARERLAKLPKLQKDGALPSPNRVALVVGNGAYRNVPALENPTKDAAAVAKALEGVGFTVVKLADDLPRDALLQALHVFSLAAAKAEWATVYYAGHGMEVGGVNYMIPVDAKLAADKDAETEAISLDLILAAASGASKMRLVMLDSCRDNPFAKKMQRSIGLQLVSRGLSNIEPEAGMMVVYATRHGEVAMDGQDGHSPFATAVIKDLPRPGLEIRRFFDVVRDEVMIATNREQQPFSYGSLPGNEDFFFVPKK
jgi:tetratricopeptide (TPR) repeat protein